MYIYLIYQYNVIYNNHIYICMKQQFIQKAALNLKESEKGSIRVSGMRNQNGKIM